ncbi:unnamed protein product, partial [Staurois parvus]
MDTDRWHFWGHTDHQGTLIIKQRSAPIIRALMISALMIHVQQCHPPVPSSAQQCRQSVLPSSDDYQYPSSVPPHQRTSV